MFRSLQVTIVFSVISILERTLSISVFVSIVSCLQKRLQRLVRDCASGSDMTVLQRYV